MATVEQLLSSNAAAKHATSCFTSISTKDISKCTDDLKRMRDYIALHTFISQRSAMPFAWGYNRNDCVSFAAAAVLAATGREIGFGGARWHTASGAARVLKRLGGLQTAVDRELTRVAVPFAQRGDVVAVVGARGLLLAVIEGDTVVGPGPLGIMRLPRAASLIAWGAE